MSVCPRCHETVPRTLYCLNCGYPLYKEAKGETPVGEGAGAPVAGGSGAEGWIEKGEAKPPEALEEHIEEEGGKVEACEAGMDEGTKAVAVEDKTPEPATIPPAVELEEGTPENEEAVRAEAVEPPTLEQVEETPEVRGEPIVEGSEEAVEVEAGGEEAVRAVAEATEMPGEEGQMPRPEIDPMILEVMDNLAKNISLKIRLVNLAIRGEIKETILKKLLENYAAKGELWMNRRNEILERGRYEISTLEKEIECARAGLEELDIRRAIGDASDDEYAAKAPAYEWDINHLNEKLTRKSLEIGHLESLSKVMSMEDFETLKAIASSCQRDIDGIATTGRLSPETVAEIKSILEDAMELLKD
jgi:hypothetical protein